jgi:hypothetical protein
MNVNIRLNKAALSLLLTFLAAFAAGFHTGKGYAEQSMHQPANNGVVNTR